MFHFGGVSIYWFNIQASSAASKRDKSILAWVACHGEVSWEFPWVSVNSKIPNLPNNQKRLEIFRSFKNNALQKLCPSFSKSDDRPRCWWRWSQFTMRSHSFPRLWAGEIGMYNTCAAEIQWQRWREIAKPTTRIWQEKQEKNTRQFAGFLFNESINQSYIIDVLSIIWGWFPSNNNDIFTHSQSLVYGTCMVLHSPLRRIAPDRKYEYLRSI